MSKSITFTIPVCTFCGSPHVRVDAYASYNVKQRKWVLSDAFPDIADCVKCEGPCKIKFVRAVECECFGAQATCEQCGGIGFVPSTVQS